jgi:hypothetical protein
MALTFSALLPLTAAQLDPSGILVDTRSGFPWQARLSLLGTLLAVVVIGLSLLAVKSIWNLGLNGVRAFFNSRLAEQKVGAIRLGLLGRIVLIAFQVLIVAAGVFLLYTSDPGGVFRGQIPDETDINARFATQSTALYENPDPASRVVGMLEQNTRVSILPGNLGQSANGLAGVVVNDGPLSHQKGWVQQSLLSRTSNAGFLGYVGDFITGLVHPLTLQAIAFGCLVSGAVIGLFALHFGRFFARHSGSISILLGMLILIFRFSSLNVAKLPAAMYLLPEAFFVLTFDLVLAKIIPLLRLPTPPPVPIGANLRS